MQNDKEIKDMIIEKYEKEVAEALSDIKTPGRRHRQIPNILTLSRLLAPLAILPAAATGNVPLTIGLTAAFGFTDFVDGHIARKYNLQSKLGADLDAITDKVFGGTILLASSFANPILLINLALEGLIGAVNIKSKLAGEDPKSLYIGKAKTWFLFGLSALGIAGATINPGLIGAFSLATAIMQVQTLNAYREKYNNARTVKKIVSQEEPPKIEEHQRKHSPNELSKKIEGPTSTRTEIEKLKQARQELLGTGEVTQEKAKEFIKK